MSETGDRLGQVEVLGGMAKMYAYLGDKQKVGVNNTGISLLFSWLVLMISMGPRQSNWCNYRYYMTEALLLIAWLLRFYHIYTFYSHGGHPASASYDMIIVEPLVFSI